MTLAITTYPALFGPTSGSEIFNSGIQEMGIEFTRVEMDVFCLNDGNESMVEWSSILIEDGLRKFNTLPPGSVLMTHISEHLQAARILRSRGNMITPFYYTHSPYDSASENSPGNFFSPEHRSRTQWLMRQPEVIVGTQTETNAKYLSSVGIYADILPPFIWSIPTLDRLPTGSRRGVIWGTYYEPGNDRKGFEQFVRDYGKAGYFLKIMVQKDSEQNVIDYLENHGVKDYDVRAGISGDEKNEFIQTASFGVCYSKSESYGLFMAEMASVIPVYCPKYYPWMAEFNVPIGGGWTSSFIIDKVNKKTVEIWESFRRAYGF